MRKLLCIAALLVATTLPASAQPICQPVEIARQYVESIGGRVISEDDRVANSRGVTFMYWTANGMAYVTVVYDGVCAYLSAIPIGPLVEEAGV